MIRTLTLEGYRGFEEYQLRKLRTVNLLVGPNNCGKTSVLEAVQLLVSSGDPSVLAESARRRWESHAGEVWRSGTRYPLHHQFHGHRLDPGVGLSVSSSEAFGRVRIQVVEGELGDSDDFIDVIRGTARPLALLIRTGQDDEGTQFPLTEDGSLNWSSPAMRLWPRGRPKSPPIRFVTADSLHVREMAHSWNWVIREGRESEVVEAMRILEKDLQSIHFLTSDTARGVVGLGRVLLGFQDGDPRIPIGSHGDGMRRLLLLSLSLLRVAEGFLLIDEIDTGLHWSVMEQMWNLVIEAAAKSSIQVFATTHSLDCILGLAELLKKRPDLADSVSVQKIERQLEHSVSFGATDIVTAADLSIELR
ncbi:MAG: AAA family ATPase [Bryobacterales bacterium]|nr:AAA family ATPase [Bryobacterales bacterium]